MGRIRGSHGEAGAEAGPRQLHERPGKGCGERGGFEKQHTRHAHARRKVYRTGSVHGAVSVCKPPRVLRDSSGGAECSHQNLRSSMAAQWNNQAVLEWAQET